MSFSVKTKYDIGNTVWYIRDNKARYAEITGFSISVEANKTEIKYTLHYDSGKVEESLAFPTKEELLKSL